MNKKIKVLQFPISNSYGGITHYALENWKWMDKKKFECDFATMSKEIDFEDEIISMGSKIHYISCYAEKDEKQFRKEINEILDIGYDIVHLHTKQWKSFLVEEICKERKISKVIVHSHSTRCDANDKIVREKETKEHYKIREQITEDIATDFWACSHLAAEWLFDNRIPKNKVCIINNAIDVDKFIFNMQIREQLRKEYNVEGKVVIGNIGRLVYPKNHSFLLDTFARVHQENPNIVLIILGDGELKEKLKMQAFELGIFEDIMFLGTVKEAYKFYQMMDLFLLPSNFEGLPITLVEAQASGLKCIASDVITKEVKMSDKLQYLPLDIGVWKEKILSIEYKYERDKMKQMVIKNGYSIKEYIKIIESYYSKL